MNLQKLRDQLIIDEGVRYRIYFDTKGRATMGIGHLITRKDPEYYQAQELSRKLVSKVEISKERAEELFKQDLQICLNNCKQVFPDFDEMVEELQLILANMMFNMGLGVLKPKPSHFLSMQNFIIAIKKRDYKKAADEMKDSLWYKEVKGRGARLTQEMRNLA